MNVCIHLDRDIGPDFGASTLQPVISGPQQQDQLHSWEHCRRERVLTAAGYSLWVWQAHLIHCGLLCCCGYRCCIDFNTNHYKLDMITSHPLLTSTYAFTTSSIFKLIFSFSLVLSVFISLCLSWTLCSSKFSSTQNHQAEWCSPRPSLVYPLQRVR